jgi:sucrose-6-phosphate hydrolase SacC (GH32 family)
VLGIAALGTGWCAQAEAEDMDGFRSLFDGKTLDGWKAADMSYWSVEDGAITGKITQDHPLKNNLYLIWQGGEPADFEIKMKHRLRGSPGINGGFQFRSKELPNHDVAGYQMDNNLNTDWLVRLYDEHGRDTLAMRGQRAVFDEQGKAQHTRIPEAEGAPWFKLEEWHEYHLICEGPRLTLKVDGRLAAEVVDNDPKQQDFSGILGLQLHSGPPTTAQFKDIRLKILKPASAAPKPAAAEKSAAPAPIRDKTLVAWVAPANLTQRGGSVLTLDDRQTHFDGIVFGELAPGKWMAGSDFFRRTQRDQGGWSEETADAKTVVQVAIAYKGQEVTIYRNGQRYAQYAMASPPQEFGPQSAVVLGKRHLDQGDDACFGGVVEDVRIYDQALSAQEIAALKPNEPSDPKPWAWWTFDDKEPKDRTGRFAAARLVGGAKVEGGRLVLDGQTGTLLAARSAEDLAAVGAAAPPSGVAGAAPPSALSDIQAARWLRQRLLADPYRPAYHFVIPEGYAMPFDPNGAIFWKGRYHLFYIFQDQRGHNWGHVSSTDLLHWRHHPTGLVSGMFSGNAFINKDGRPTMCYHQVGQGNAMAVALDDELNTWEKLASNPITPKTEKGDPHHDKYQSWDPYGWLEGGTYYAIFGGQRPAIVKCDSLGGDWKYVGDLMAQAVEGVSINEDVSCADFFRIGDKRMLLCISHRLGSRYYLGQWKNEQFYPEFHERMSWVDNAYFAPESLLDDKGRRIMWAWIFDQRSEERRQASGWSGEMSLPRVLWLGEDKTLRLRPVEELERLRYNEQTVENVTIEADKEVVLDKIAGNTIELMVEIEPQGAAQCGVKVCRAPDGAEQTLVYYDAADKKLKIDVTKASLGEGPKNVEAGPFELKQGETLTLRVFVDKSVVEAFANDRQAVMRRIYPTRADSLGVSLFSQGGATKVRRVKAWDMAPSNPY